MMTYRTMHPTTGVRGMLAMGAVAAMLLALSTGPARPSGTVLLRTRRRSAPLRPRQ